MRRTVEQQTEICGQYKYNDSVYRDINRNYLQRKHADLLEDSQHVGKKSRKYDKQPSINTKIPRESQHRYFHQQFNITKQNGSRIAVKQRPQLQNLKTQRQPSRLTEKNRQDHKHPIKKVVSKAELIIRQAKSQLCCRLPEITFLAIDVYNSMTESEKSKVNNRWKQAIQHQLIIVDKIRAQTNQQCQLAESHSAGHKRIQSDVVWVSPPVHEWQRQLIGVSNSYFQHACDLRETYFKILASRLLMRQNQQ